MARELSLEQCLQMSIYTGILQANYDGYCAAYGAATGKSVSQISMSDLLCLTFDSDCYECDDEGKIHFYRKNTSGGYVQDGGGDYVRVNLANDDGSLREIYLHYAQIYKPTELVRKMINTVFLALAISYEYYQSMAAELNSYARELEELSTRLCQLNNEFARLSMHNSSYGCNGDDFELSIFTPNFWKQLLESGVVDLHHYAITDVEPPLLSLAFKTDEINFEFNDNKEGISNVATNDEYSDWYVMLFTFDIDSVSENLIVKAVENGGFWYDSRGKENNRGEREYTLKVNADRHRNSGNPATFKSLKNKVKFLSCDEPLHFLGSCPTGNLLDLPANIYSFFIVPLIEKGRQEINKLINDLKASNNLDDVFNSAGNLLKNGVNEITKMITQLENMTDKDIEDTIDKLLSYRTAVRGDENTNYDPEDARRCLLYYKLYDTLYHYELGSDDPNRPVSLICQGEGIGHYTPVVELNQRIDTRKYAIKTSIKDIIGSDENDDDEKILSFVPKREIKIFTDKIRSVIDATNSTIGSAVNVFTAVTQNFSQVFTAATELISNTGANFMKIARNAR
ncbi:MAG: hypothetical protein LBI69_04265 [Puniceicoccales bacterium]|jgi:hypothetical protein|nr:hypothetical protein [Puniceicoccales bacterium]